MSAEALKSVVESLELEECDDYSPKILETVRIVAEAEELSVMHRLDLLHQVINRWSEVIDL